MWGQRLSDFDIAIQIIAAVMTLKIYARCPAQITLRKVAMSWKLWVVLNSEK